LSASAKSAPGRPRGLVRQLDTQDVDLPSSRLEGDRAFSEHQQISEERRHLAAEIGELIARFVVAGWSEEQTRNADVHRLAAAAAR